ncbi:MAG: AIR synthase-related protein [Nanoarchaeota archaeon]|nr:AIR synthase-related protein [Nanoarchaeota archaeon]
MDKIDYGKKKDFPNQVNSSLRSDSTDYQKREARAVDAIKKAIPSSLKRNMHSISKGMFAELYENDKVFPDHLMACGVDGVGTKLILAEAMQKFDTVGIDLVAMNSNDLATLGKVSPFIFIDYFAVQSEFQEKGLTGDLMNGIVKGLEMSEVGDILRSSIHINMGKGETASVDELISGLKPGMGFDIAGAMIGFIKKEDLNTQVKAGDKIIALKSSGPHSNGYTDLRLKLLNGDFETRPEFKKNYTGSFKLDDKFENSTIGETILKPTKIYSKTVAAIANEMKVVGINNTGYGLKNFNRLKGFQFSIDNPIQPQPIFDLVQKESKFTDEQMYKKFNMGQGFFMIVDSKDADKALSIAEKFGEQAQIVGEVQKGEGTILIKDNKKILFEGY